jgi:hypothetical protein
MGVGSKTGHPYIKHNKVANLWRLVFLALPLLKDLDVCLRKLARDQRKKMCS